MFIETIIPLMCAGAAGAYNPACQSAAMATSKQTSVYEYADKAETVIKAKVQGITFKEVIVVGAVGAQIVRSRRVSYTFKNPIISDSLQVNFTQRDGSIGMKWNIP